MQLGFYFISLDMNYEHSCKFVGKFPRTAGVASLRICRDLRCQLHHVEGLVINRISHLEGSSHCDCYSEGQLICCTHQWFTSCTRESGWHPQNVCKNWNQHWVAVVHALMLGRKLNSEVSSKQEWFGCTCIDTSSHWERSWCVSNLHFPCLEAHMLPPFQSWEVVVEWALVRILSSFRED